MRYLNLRGAQVPQAREVEIVNVMKQQYGYTRYRFRIAGEDVSHAYLRSLPYFKVKYSSNMTEKDIAKVEAVWGLHIVKEILQ